MSTKVSIFEYDSASEFLKAVFEQKKRERPSFSIRSWSLRLNAGHVTSLARILNNQRKIPLGMVKVLGDSLDLQPHERTYFEILALGKGKISFESLQIIRNCLSRRIP